MKNLPIENKIRASFFLCSELPGELLGFIDVGWNKEAGLPPQKKAELLREEGLLSRIDEIFPLTGRLSKFISDEQEDFIFSHLVQPNLFLRIRPGYEKLVAGKVESANIPGIISGTTVTLPNSMDAAAWFEVDREVVVQDFSSQQTGNFILDAAATLGRENPGPKVWDCCAASGGKSLLAYDILDRIQLTVSDLRPSILENLHERFNRAGVRTYQSFTADLSKKLKGQHGKFDMIIADVPCSGSGTWGRTPEELSFFSEEKLAQYVSLQRKIIAHSVPFLVPGGQYLYFTCSVYADENEEAIDYMVRNFGFTLSRMDLLKGYKSRADTMFAARLTSPG